MPGARAADTLDRMSTPTSTDRVTLRAPDDVLAKVPFLIGFHPTESLVALAFDDSRQLRFATRIDLPASSDGDAVADMTRRLVRLLCTRGACYSVLVAYTACRQDATPILRTVLAAFGDAGITVLDALVADGRRWWSDVCADPECCPPEGRPYDLSRHPVTARSIYGGEVALADQEALRRSLAPPCGPERSAMETTLRRIEAEVASDGSSEDGGVPPAMEEGPDSELAAVQSRAAYVCELLRAHRPGGRQASDEEVARVAIHVADVTVRDEVWSSMTAQSARQHVAFWTEVVRRVVAPYDVAPAALLAFAAWLQGKGALARCALERAHASDPGYTMARLIEDLLLRGVPPEAWTPPHRAC